MGICFNSLPGILGLMGFEFLDALFATTTFLTIIGAVALQHLISRSEKEKS